MNNTAAILRSLIVYAVIVPVAVFVGFLLTNPLDYSTFAYAGIFALLLIFPLLLKWHQPLLLLSWNASISVFFIKGSPSLFLVLVALSLGISLLERALNARKQFLHAPQITWPLLSLVAVVLFTAKLTGGFGLHAFGSEVMGGKKYIFLIVGILSFFALTAQRIPPERAKWFAAFFILGETTKLVGDLFPITPSGLHFIFWFFPPTAYDDGDFQFGVTRLGGVGQAAYAVACWLVVQYGLRGIFLSGKLWRPALLMLAFAGIFLGGFRSAVLQTAIIFTVLFFIEGLHRTRIMPAFVLTAMLLAVAVVPLARHLPYTFQRALAFLPLDLDPDARGSAQDSSEWRVRMWTALLPQVPQHLLLGKGYAISQEDFEMMGQDSSFKSIDAGQQALALSGDYHNGLLSVILPFGIWGMIAFFWFMIAGLHAMYCNFRYGDPALQTINNFLWVSFAYLCFRFVVLGGALATDMGLFLGPLGLSIALNGGICRPARRTVPAAQSFERPKALTRPRPVFQR